MKDLVYKELVLVNHPAFFIFTLLSAMILIPAYPYFIAFFYICLAVFQIFQLARENKDLLFTAMLPIGKKEIVKARCYLVVIIQMAQIALGVIFAIIRYYLIKVPNEVGMEANTAFFGFVLIMFAIFNTIFINGFYKTAYKIGMPFVWASLAIGIYIIVVEVSVQMIPTLKEIWDTVDIKMLPMQIPVLAAGVVIYVLSMVAVYRNSSRKLEKVDI